MRYVIGIEREKYLAYRQIRAPPDSAWAEAHPTDIYAFWLWDLSI